MLTEELAREMEVKKKLEENLNKIKKPAVAGAASKPKAIVAKKAGSDDKVRCVRATSFILFRAYSN